MLTQFRNLFTKAIHYWGFDKQFGMVAEENHEIGLLLEKRRRHGIHHILSRIKKNPDGSEEVENISIHDWLVEECADGLVMLTQLAMMLGEGQVHAEIERKINRLRDKIFLIDEAPKIVTCNECGQTFKHYVEFTDKTNCIHCGQKLFTVGYTWIIDKDGKLEWMIDEDQSVSGRGKSVSDKFFKGSDQ